MRTVRWEGGRHFGVEMVCGWRSGSGYMGLGSCLTCARNVRMHAATRGREIFSKYFLQFSFSILYLGGDDALKSFFHRLLSTSFFLLFCFILKFGE